MDDDDINSIQLARASAYFTVASESIGNLLLSVLDNNDDGSANKRQKSIIQQRLDWYTFVEKNKHSVMFKRHLRMTYESFSNLLLLIKDHLKKVDKEMAKKRGGEVIKELRLYATIRYLAGGSYSDICYFCGISKSTFYRILWETINAINKTIKIEFPQSPEECATAAADFEKISYSSIMKNVVGVLDGYLLHIVTPRKKKNRNVRSYFSGHYQRYGVNIQASCDAHGRFTFVGVGGPGVIKDRNAVKVSGLHSKIENIPQGYVCIADCAYQPTEKLTPIFGGNLALITENDNYNYFASQLRIRIEMAFGLMTKKWGILQRPISISVERVKHIILCIARLHNFCINERLLNKENNLEDNNLEQERRRNSNNNILINNQLSTMQLAYMHAASEIENEQILSEEFPQWSLARDRLVKLVKQSGLKRPLRRKM
jgi:hypothetical protein